jgi:hypothetical protein
VAPERRSLESRNAVGVQPGVEAVDVRAAALDHAVAVETGGAGADVALLAVGAADGFPVAGEGVAVPASAAEGGADHVHRAVGHRSILNIRTARRNGGPGVPVETERSTGVGSGRWRTDRSSSW